MIRSNAVLISMDSYLRILRYHRWSCGTLSHARILCMCAFAYVCTCYARVCAYVCTCYARVCAYVLVYARIQRGQGASAPVLFTIVFCYNANPCTFSNVLSASYSRTALLNMLASISSSCSSTSLNIASGYLILRASKLSCASVSTHLIAGPVTSASCSSSCCIMCYYVSCDNVL